MTTQNLTFETRAEFKGFDRHYDKDIHPYLLAREQERKRQSAEGQKYGTITASIFILIASAIAMRTGIYFLSLIVGAIGVMAGFGVRHSMLSKLRGETKQFLMDSICGYLDWEFTQKDFPEPNLELLRDNRLLPSWDRVSFEDRMSGQVGDAEFTFCEAHLESRSTDSDGKTKWSTSFRGILLDVDFHRVFLGRTVVLRDAGIFNFKKKAGMKRVGLVDPKFEKIFEAYGTDQVEARYLLTPVFMQKLVDLETSVSGKKTRFGFLADKLHIAVEAPNQFEAGSMYTPLTDTARTEKILKEISAIFDVINGVARDKRRR